MSNPFETARTTLEALEFVATVVKAMESRIKELEAEILRLKAVAKDDAHD